MSSENAGQWFRLVISEYIPLVFDADGAGKQAAIASKAVRTIRLDGSPDFLEVNASGVWVTNGRLNRLDRINAQSGATEAQVQVDAPCGGMATAAASLWVASCKTQTLVRIDLLSNRVLAQIATGLADPEGEHSLAATEEGVWAATDDGGIVSLVDPTSNTVAAKVRVKPFSYALATGFDAVWISNTGPPDARTGSVQRIDPSARRVVAEIPTGPQPRFLTAGEGAVWVLNQGDGTVSRIDPALNRTIATIPVGVPGPGGDIATGHGFVWVRGETVLLSVIDPKSNGVVARFGPPAGSGAVRATTDGVWVSAHDVNTLWLIPGSDP